MSDELDKWFGPRGEDKPGEAPPPPDDVDHYLGHTYRRKPAPRAKPIPDPVCVQCGRVLGKRVKVARWVGSMPVCAICERKPFKVKGFGK